MKVLMAILKAVVIIMLCFWTATCALGVLGV